MSGWPTVAVPTEGTLVGGRYALSRRLGRGGMGEVWLAGDRSLTQPVALRLLPPELAASPRSRARLKEEARLAIRRSHPHLVRLHSFEESGGLGFLVMEYVEGASLPPGA